MQDDQPGAQAVPPRTVVRRGAPQGRQAYSVAAGAAEDLLAAALRKGAGFHEQA